MRRGVTLPELVSVIVIIGIVTAAVVPPLVRALDRAAVDEAADRYAALHETARQLAVVRASLARIEIDTARRTATISVKGSTAWDTVDMRPLGSARIQTRQSVVTFGPMGYGWGLSNTTITLVRGTAAETLTVSRTGRLKRG